MNFDPVHVPRERGWRGTANRLVIWLTHRPWTAVGLLCAGAVAAVALQSVAVGTIARQQGLRTWWLTLSGVAAATLILGAPLLIRLGARGRELCPRAVAWCGALVLLPAVTAVAVALGMAASGRPGTVFSLATLLVPLGPAAVVSLLSVVAFAVGSRVTRRSFSFGSWCVALALFAVGSVGLAVGDALLDGWGGWASGVVCLVPILLARAGWRTIWLVPVLAVFGADLASGLSQDFYERINGVQPDAFVPLQTVIPSLVGFFLGAIPYVLLLRRADRMTVLSERED